MEGMFYVAGNILGLATPLTDATPTTTEGEFLDMLIAVWSLSLAAVAIGLVGNFSFISYVPEKIEGKEYTDVTEVLIEVVAARQEIAEVVDLSS
jgi:hypothetical protein